MAPASLRVLAPPSSDTSDTPTLVLQWEAAKYLFNAGEGTTRISAQHRASNSRVDHVFFTRVASETIGGVPGLLMTLADGGRESITLHGPPNLRYALATSRFYARREVMTVDAREIEIDSPYMCFVDERIRVDAVPLVPRAAREQYAALPKPDATPLDLDTQPWRNPVWRPGTLTGAAADAWYSAVIADAWSRRGGAPPSPSRAWTPSRVPHALPAPPLPAAARGASAGRQAVALAYIVAGHEQRGKFDATRAAELGVPPGPAFSALTRGESVRIARPVQWAALDADARAQWLRAQRSGKKGAQAPADVPLEQVDIESRDVVGAPRAGAVFFYMDVPTLEHLEALLEANDAFAPYTAAANAALEPMQRQTPHVILHAAAPEVMRDVRYQQWMAQFGDCVHLGANRAVCADRLTYTSSAQTLLRLRCIDPNVFHVPGYTLTPTEALPCVLPVRENMFVNLHPRAQPAQLPEVAPVLDRLLHELDVRGDLDESRWEAYRAAVAAAAAAGGDVPAASAAAARADDLTFTTLGTGSSAPSKYRNVLSTLVHLPGDGYILLDGGESTYLQLARRCGPGERGWEGVGIETVLREMRLVFVSHIHGDHHMGLARLLRERRRLDAPPLFLVANNYTLYYLYEYDLVESLGLRDGRVVTLDDAQLLGDSSSADGAALSALKSALRLRHIQTVPVEHRMSHCYGLVLEHVDGWKIVFSGDSMPCAALAAAGRDATVLVHEATMEDDDAELAAAKGHSTVGQALQIAADMRAAHVLLTHFSQRYPKLARITKRAGVPPVGIAFDMARMTPRDIRRLERAHAAMALLLEVEAEGDPEDEPEQLETPRTTAKARPTEAPAHPPAKRARARHVETTFEYNYVVLGFAADAGHVPSELSVQQGIARALQDTHGVVGGAVAFDVLHAGTPLAPAPGVVGEAVVRVPSAHVDMLLDTLSSLPESHALTALTGGQAGMRVFVRSVTHNPTMLCADSRAWMRSL